MRKDEWEETERESERVRERERERERDPHYLSTNDKLKGRTSSCPALGTPHCHIFLFRLFYLPIHAPHTLHTPHTVRYTCTEAVYPLYTRKMCVKKRGSNFRPLFPLRVAKGGGGGGGRVVLAAWMCLFVFAVHGRVFVHGWVVTDHLCSSSSGGGSGNSSSRHLTPLSPPPPPPLPLLSVHAAYLLTNIKVHPHVSFWESLSARLLLEYLYQQWQLLWPQCNQYSEVRELHESTTWMTP